MTDGRKSSAIAPIYEKVLDGIQQERKRNLDGQISLFQSFEDAISDTLKEDVLPQVAELHPKRLLAMEKEVLGFYISGHPLAEFEEEIKNISTIYTTELAELGEAQQHHIKDGTFVRIAGLIAHRKNKVTKNNNMMAFITLEDLLGSIEVLAFPTVLEKYIICCLKTVHIIEGRLVSRRKNQVCRNHIGADERKHFQYSNKPHQSEKTIPEDQQRKRIFKTVKKSSGF